ncbi:MAG TPA: flagellar hook capping FlgD N-terminal domain-containing protein [Acidobacteriaceae bacterium]
MSIAQPTASGMSPFSTGRADSASDPSPSSSGTTSTATVTANDFLQLLVSEMKNQDPTANTDPNEYINQLVQVNSLEQLVQINQELGGSSSTSSNSGATGSVVNAPSASESSRPPGSLSQEAGTSGTPTGNLNSPLVSGAATRVAQALQFPSAANPPADLRNIVQTPASHKGAFKTGISTAR